MSDDDEDSMPIAATITKATKAKKAAKGELSSPCCMSHAVFEASILTPASKRISGKKETTTSSEASSFSLLRR